MRHVLRHVLRHVPFLCSLAFLGGCSAQAPREVPAEGDALETSPEALSRCGPTPLAPVCNTPRCTAEGWVFWPRLAGTACTISGGPGICDGGDLGPPGQIEPNSI